MKPNRLIRFSVILMIVLSLSSPAFSEEKSVDLSQPSQSFNSSPVERIGDGFANIVYGPFELIYQLKEEVKRTDPVRGFVPGLFRGISWFATREVVGIFEMVTFFLPLDPHLEPFDTSWLRA
jgi:putative exosortase-associated protein (TIGR04073 family)